MEQFPTWFWFDTLGNGYSDLPITSICFDTIGTYYICLAVQDANGCDDDTCMLINVVVPSSIYNQEETYISSLYPNPATTHLTIEQQLPISAKQTASIYDLTGKLLLQFSISNPKSTVDISGLSPGVYLLSLSDGEQVLNRKVVKQ